MPGRREDLSQTSKVRAFGFFRAAKLDGDAGFVVADDATRDLANDNDFSDGRPDRRFERQAAERKIYNLTGRGLTIAARELGKLAA